MIKSSFQIIRYDLSGDHPERSVRKLGKKAAGRMLDGRAWDEMPKLAQVTS